MNDLLKELLKPRTIFAFMFYLAYINMVLSGMIRPESITNIVMALMGYYFGAKKEKI